MGPGFESQRDHKKFLQLIEKQPDIIWLFLFCANICANIFRALMFILPEKSQKIENKIMTLDPHGLKKPVSFKKVWSPKWGITQNLGLFNN